MDSSNEIKDRYAKEAETYRSDAWLVNVDSERLFEVFKSIARKLHNSDEEIKILDIGAGNGMLTEVVLDLFPNAKITMLDFSPEMLESAKAFFEKGNISLDRIEFVVKNFIDDEFPKEKYDLIISSFALHHIRSAGDLKNVYLKIAKSLKANGTFLCIDFFLEESDELRKEQGKAMLNKWTQNYNSASTSLEWANILKTEDSPSTLPLIISSLKNCNKYGLNIIPFVYTENGIMSTIYGMTLLNMKKMNELQLSQYVEETLKYIGKEELIDSFDFGI